MTRREDDPIHPDTILDPAWSVAVRRTPLVCLSLALALLHLAGGSVGAEDRPRLDLKDGDRIVMIGDDLIERDQKSGYLETLLTLMHPDKNLVFRNLGWSGDTVYGDARAGFGGRADGFKQLREHVLALKPTVLLVGYGMSESFDGESGLPSFEKGLNELLDTLAPTRARVVLLTPISHEDLGRPLPEPSEHNRGLKRYGEAIGRIADQRGFLSVNLLDLSEEAMQRYPHATNPAPTPKLTDDGIHLNDTGYRLLALRVASRMVNPKLPVWSVHLDTGTTTPRRSQGTHLKGIETSPVCRFEALDETLPFPPGPKTLAPKSQKSRLLEVTGLGPGTYALKIDGKPIASGSASNWNRYEPRQGPEFDQVERLRATINEKNRLYFYRWRPQNETYLFGFRKHEQGNNAREIPLFDPLVAKKEAEIAKLRVPAPHRYELVPTFEGGR